MNQAEGMNPTFWIQGPLVSWLMTPARNTCMYITAGTLGKKNKTIILHNVMTHWAHLISSYRLLISVYSLWVLPYVPFNNPFIWFAIEIPLVWFYVTQSKNSLTTCQYNGQFLIILTNSKSSFFFAGNVSYVCRCSDEQNCRKSRQAVQSRAHNQNVHWPVKIHYQQGNDHLQTRPQYGNKQGRFSSAAIISPRSPERRHNKGEQG